MISCAVHLEAPDECSHNGDLEGKLESIKRLDTRIVKPIIDALEEKGEKRSACSF